MCARQLGLAKRGRRRLSSMSALLLAAIAIAAAPAAAQTIHVPADYPTIQEAIDAADDGWTILVADGVFTGPGNRGLDFGGRLLTLASANGAGATTIDCESMGRALRFHSGETPDARVIGFTIRNGLVVDDSGGAVLCEPGPGDAPSSPTFDACIFENNAVTGEIESTALGGAMQIVGSSPVIDGCVFTGNTATGSNANTASGGAINCQDFSHPVIADCTFTENVAAGAAGFKGQASGKGGAIACQFDCMPIITGCVFDGNVATGEPGNADTGLAGAMLLSDRSDAIVSGCTFTGNAALGVGSQSGLAGAIFVFIADPLIDGCTFDDNTASLAGGAMWVQQSVSAIRECVFEGNTAQSGGAVAAFAAGNPTIRGCRFTGNSVLTDDAFGFQQEIGGGGIGTALSSAPTIVDCLFEGNASMSGYGGGVSITSGSSATIANCVFVGNEALVSGGGVNSGPLPMPLDAGSSTSLVNCLFACNGAGDHGGGVFSRSGTMDAVNCTIVQNAAGLGGGGVGSLGSNITTLENVILSGNDAPDGPQIVNIQNAATTVRYGLVQGGWPGPGNLDADPVFVDPAGPDGDPATCADNDYRLALGSPAIDSGDTFAIPADDADVDGDGDVTEPVPLDLAGALRRADDQCTADTGIGTPPIADRGAYERQPVVDACDCNGNGVEDTTDIADGTSLDFNENLIPDECEAPFEGAAFWRNPVGGLFRVGANWQPNTPGPSNTAVFDLEATYAVTFDLDILNDRLVVRRGDVTFDVEPGRDTYVYALGAPAATLVVGEQAGDDATLTVLGGELNSAGEARIAGAPGSSGALRVIGPEARFTASDALCIGGSGEGAMLVENGAFVISRDAVIGDQPGASGSVVVRGEGSLWEIPILLQVDRGSLLVESGATLAGGLLPILVFDDGRVGGDGLIDATVINLGVVRPMAGPDPLTVLGDYVQTGQIPGLGPASGSLVIAFGSAGSGRLLVSGTANLGGGLFVELGDGAVPSLGESFTLLDAAMTADQFDVAFLPVLADDLFMRVTYGAAGVAGAGLVNLTVEPLEDLLAFGGPSDTDVSGTPTDAVTGDFDGDGLPDLVLTIPADAPGLDGSVLVLRNGGDGTFTGIQQVTVGVDPSSITVGLLDDDDVLDLAVANAGDDNVSLLFGAGDGTFLPPAPGSELPVGDQPVSIAAANLHDASGSGPGVTDLVVANFGDGSISLLISGGGGVYVPFGLPIDIETPSSVHPTDLDNDKDMDLILTGGVPGVVIILENEQDEQFALAATIGVGDDPLDMPPTFALENNAGFDLDGNGFFDVITVNAGDGTVSIALNLGGLAFSAAVNLPVGETATSIAALDMDLDDDLDLAVVARTEGRMPTVFALRNDLNAGQQLAFAEPIDLGATPGTLFVLSDDLDGDDDRDLLAVNEALGGVAGAGAPMAVVSQLPNLTIVILPGDVNGDGAVDVDDLVRVILDWGPCPVPPLACPSDVDGDGVVDVDDLQAVLLNWG